MYLKYFLYIKNDKTKSDPNIHRNARIFSNPVRLHHYVCAAHAIEKVLEKVLKVFSENLHAIIILKIY